VRNLGGIPRLFIEYAGDITIEIVQPRFQVVDGWLQWVRLLDISTICVIFRV
jgi:hypothetical protein